MKPDFHQTFRDPGPEFRSAPFWAWNAAITREGVREQIPIFAEMGYGGFFIHSRPGLATPYLSREWFDRVRDAVDAAEKAGLKAWLYDEDRWPSGAAGGLVTKDKRYRMRYLHFSLDREFPKLEDSVELEGVVVIMVEFASKVSQNALEKRVDSAHVESAVLKKNVAQSLACFDDDLVKVVVFKHQLEVVDIFPLTFTQQMEFVDNALLHFVGGLVGKGYSEHVPVEEVALAQLELVFKVLAYHDFLSSRVTQQVCDKGACKGVGLA